jgi:hypothetical protein
MCTPIALGVASLVAAAAGTAMSGYSSYESSKYNAAVAQNNEIYAKQNANAALEQGQVQEEDKRLQTGEMISGINAEQAARGVVTSSGSALDVRSSAAETGELDALTIRYNANMTARNDIQNAQNYGAMASLDEAQAGWGAAGSILGGASSVSNKWLQYNQYGVFGGGGGGGAGFTGDPSAAWTNNNFNNPLQYSYGG